MAHIAIFQAAFSNGAEIVSLLPAGGQSADSDAMLVDETARRFNVAPSKLQRAMTGPDFVFNKFTRRRELCVAQLGKVMSERLEAENFVFSGFASQLIPREMPHVLRVCILDDPEARAESAAVHLGVSQLRAREEVREADVRAAQWTDYLFGASPWDRTLYDIKIPGLALGAKRAAALIIEAAGKLNVGSTEAAVRSLREFQTARSAALALADAGLFHSVTCEGGVVTVTVNEYVAFFDKLDGEIRRIVRGVPNVAEIEVHAGPRFRPATMVVDSDFALPKKILLVDDEREFVLTLSERLEMRDAAPAVAFTGEEALSMTAEEAPDVMILDLKMPGIDGMEVLRRVKAEHPDVAVIILTGHGSNADRETCLALGAFDYLEKPVNIDELAGAMRRAAQLHAQKREPTH